MGCPAGASSQNSAHSPFLFISNYLSSLVGRTKATPPEKLFASKYLVGITSLPILSINVFKLFLGTWR